MKMLLPVNLLNKLMKTTQTLERMKILNEQSMNLEKEKIKRNLERLRAVSAQNMFTNMREMPEKPSTMISSEPSQTQISATVGNTGSQLGDHLTKFATIQQNPTKKIGQTTSKPSTPLSRRENPFTGRKLPISTVSSQRGITSSIQGNTVASKTSRQGTTHSLPSHALTRGSARQEAIARTFSLPKNFSINKHFSDQRDALFGYPSFDKKLKELLAKVTVEDAKPQPPSFEILKPEEALRCRYLRLSQSNISTLVKQCEDSGFEMDLHPHMKEEDVNISRVFAHSPKTNAL